MADVDPVTCLLEGMRSPVTDGWDGGAILVASRPLPGLGAVNMAFALLALRGRVARA